MGRYYRRRSYKISILISSLLIVLFFVFGILIGSFGANANNKRLESTVTTSVLGAFTDSQKLILNMALPLIGMDIATTGENYTSGDKLAQKVFASIASLDIKNPKSLLGSEITFIKTVEMEGKDEIISESPGLTEEERRFFEELERRSKEAQLINPQRDILDLSSNPLVLIYNTHNSETYEPTDGTKKVEGKNGGVEKVAAHLEQVLLKTYGIQSIRSTTIHDYPNWEKSYINSAETVKKILKENPSIQVVLDIHRDAGLPEKGVVTTSTGVNMAKILLIVGSDNRLEHPKWQQNWQFAKMIGYKMDKLYPGLLKAVRVQTGRYNQHLHERSLLVEVGCTQNSLEEAKRSAEALAHVLYEVLLDLRQENTF